MFHPYFEVGFLISLHLACAASLRCHEGFNITVGGIPFYLWAKHNCPVNNTCMIREIAFPRKSNETSNALVIRYGGCVSSSIETHMSCSSGDQESSPPITFSEVMLESLRSMDYKILQFLNDFENEAGVLLQRFFSRGTDIEEFCDGVINFLHRLGYEKDKVREPMQRFVSSIAVDDTISVMVKAGDVFSAMKVENQATKKLSRAFRRYLKSFSLEDKIHAHDLSQLDMAAGLMYPVLLRMEFDADSVFHEIARAFESPEVVLEEKYATAFLTAQIAVNSYIRRLDKEGRSSVLEKSERLIRRYRTAYPENSQIRKLEITFNTQRNFKEKVAAACEIPGIKCLTGWMEAYLEMCKSIVQNSDDELWYVRFLQMYVDALSAPKVQNAARQLSVAFLGTYLDMLIQPEAYSGKWFSRLIDKSGDTLARLFEGIEEVVERNGARYSTENVLFRCKDYHCSTNLCNSHENFEASKPEKRSPEILSRKTEL